MIDTESMYAWLTLATANLLVLGGAITAILKEVGTRRALRNAYRLQLARWLDAAGRQSSPVP
jgi:hypothetical protein